MDPGVFFGKRPFCRLSEALEVAADVAVHAEEPVDIVIVPPEPSVDTDVEEADDDGTTDTNSQPEYHWATPTRGTKERELNLKSLFFGKSPNEVFSTILDDEVLTHIVVHTGKYAKENNEHGFVINIEDEGGNSEVRPKCVFSCGACGELFSAQDLLEKHRRRKHPQRPEGRHCCAHCPYSSDRKPNVVRHVRTHTGWRPFLCQVCGKGFARLDHLTGHQLVHSGEGLHECPECGQRFSQASNQTGCSPQGAALCGRRGCLAPVYPLREVVQP
ncbi:uncharacterized protein LOC144116338 [Amblyomma americanum]